MADERPDRWAQGLFLAAWIGFFLALFIAIVLFPQGLWANHGFSYYGEQPRTELLYRLAYASAGLGTLLCALRLPGRRYALLRTLFFLMAPALLGLILTTNPPNRLVSDIHVGIGTTLFIAQLAAGFWLAVRDTADRRQTALLAVLVAGGLVSLLSLLNYQRYLIEGQILFQLAFGLLVWRTLGKNEFNRV